MSPLYLYSCPLTILHFEQLCYEAPQLEVLFLMLWSTTMFLKLFIKHSIRQTWKVKYVFAGVEGFEPSTNGLDFMVGLEPTSLMHMYYCFASPLPTEIHEIQFVSVNYSVYSPLRYRCAILP